ncbi:MAG: hypothetical protein RRB13_08150 [bacterium]|nr:hypothetical protein [bacterium]
MNLSPDYKWVLPGFGLLILVAIALTNYKGPAPWYASVEDYQISQISPAELARWIVEGRNDFLAVAVGDSEELNTIPGLIRVANQEELAAALKKYPNYKKWVILNNGSPLSPEMAQMATQDWERRVILLKGGVPQWQARIGAEELDWSQIPAEETAELKEVRAFFHQGGAAEAEQYVAPKPVVMPFLADLPPPPKAEGC